MKVLSSSATGRTILLRLEDNDQLPESLAIGLEIEGVSAGWMRASGILADLDIRAGEAIRRINGLVMAVNIESVAYQGELVLRGVFTRDTGASIETFAGEIVRARVVTLDAIITVLDGSPAAARPAPPLPERKPPTPAWTGAMDASARSPEPSPKPQAVLPARTDPMPVPPPKLRRPDANDADQIFPEAGDVVEHFAFGRCEVIKSDGDRLHVKLARDGRIREIALEMLKVVTLEPADGHKRFRLDRRL